MNFGCEGLKRSVGNVSRSGFINRGGHFAIHAARDKTAKLCKKIKEI
jgi:hypothetical protein